MDNQSVRETLQAALDSHAETAQVAAPVETPAVDPGAAEAAAVETPATQDEAATGAPQRDDKGRFAPKAGEPGAEAPVAAAAEPKIETEKPAEEGPQTEATRIPPSLSAAVKAQWNELPEVVRKDIERLENSVQTAKAEWGRKGERLNRYDEIMGPHLDRARVNGMDEFSTIQTLLAAQNVLDRNPIDGLVQIARSYGVTPQHIAQALGYSQPAGQTGAEGYQAPTGAPDLTAALRPALDPLLARFQTLEERLNSHAQASEAAERAKVQAEVATFASDPANIYFENVRPAVAKLIESGAATSLQEAYEQATWASPEIRPLLLAEQAKQAQADLAKKAKEQADRNKSSQAQAAAGSVTGSPSPGAQALNAGPQPSLREELSAQMAAFQGRA